MKRINWTNQKMVKWSQVAILLVAAISFSIPGFAKSRSATSSSSEVPSADSPPGAAPANAGDPEKLDVSDLERKYWTAKDTDFDVVQNRLYSKAGRYSVSTMIGQFINDPWSDGWIYGVGASYYFTERYGVELSYNKADTKDNQASEQLSTQGGKANHGKYKQFYGAAFNWVPFYAKMSVLNSSITYFDMSISPGVGISEYEQQMDIGNSRQSSLTWTLDVTQHFFINKYSAVRVDLKNRWYQEDIAYYSSGTAAGRPRVFGTELNHTSILMLGLNFYF